MSSLFGPIRQIGYVVPDLDEAITNWLHVGVGPFFRINDLQTNYFRVHGKDVPLHLDVALAFTGEIQIELIQQMNEAPTPYREFLLRCGAGMQHLSSWSDDYDRDVSRVRANGLEQIIDGEVRIDAENGIRFSYWAPAFEPRALMELSQVTACSQAMNDRVKQASIGWDGANPVRTF